MSQDTWKGIKGQIFPRAQEQKEKNNLGPRAPPPITNTPGHFPLTLTVYTDKKKKKKKVTR